ncbi:MAG: hypothetical protein JJU11_11010, partial [Candidatus Sumerlaeia bacterium]|nr:hypothetical protein [Candidatus Sumerlaeia bacterium]
LASEEFILHVSTISNQSRRSFDEAERHLRRLENLYETPNPTTIKLRAENQMGRGDHFGAASAFELWIEMVGVEGMGDPLEIRIEEIRGRFMDSLGPRMIGLRRTRASHLIQQGQYQAALNLLETTSELGVRDWTQDLREASALLVSSKISRASTEEARLILERCRPHLAADQYDQFLKAIRVRVAADNAGEGKWSDAFTRLQEAGVRANESEALNRALHQAINARFIKAAQQNAWERCRSLLDEANRHGVQVASAFELALILHQGVDQATESKVEQLLAGSLEAVPGCADIRMPRVASLGSELASTWNTTGRELQAAFQIVEREQGRIATFTRDIESATQTLGNLTSDLATLRQEVADAQQRDTTLRNQRANLERDVQRLRADVERLQRQEDVADVASGVQAAADWYTRLGGQGGRDLQRGLRVGSNVAGEVERQTRNTEALQNSRNELAEKESQLGQLPGSTNYEEVARANLQDVENRAKTLQEREASMAGDLQAARQALQEAEQAYRVAQERRRTEFTQRSTAFPSTVINAALDAGILNPLDERWDNGADLYTSFNHLRERGLVEDIEFEIPPPEFTMEPDLEFMSARGIR